MNSLEYETGEVTQLHLGERILKVAGVKEILEVLESGQIQRSEKVVNNDLYEISQESMMRLSEGRWLNDECINAYVALINQREREINPTQVATLALNTFFFTMLEDMQNAGAYNFRKLNRYITKKKVQLREVKNLLIPINIRRCHWLLMNVHIPTSTFYLIDSLGSPNCDKYVHLVSQFLEDYFNETIGQGKTIEEESLKKWRATCPKDVTKQINMSDCGLHTCLNMEVISRLESRASQDLPTFEAGLKFPMSEEISTEYRRKLMIEILAGQIL